MDAAVAFIVGNDVSVGAAVGGSSGALGAGTGAGAVVPSNATQQPHESPQRFPIYVPTQ